MYNSVPQSSQINSLIVDKDNVFTISALYQVCEVLCDILWRRPVKIFG